MGAFEAPLADPPQLVENLIVDILYYLDIPEGTENSLIAKLEAAKQKLEDNNENNDAAAINNLQAFINQVEAQRGKKISEEDADYLISKAQQIIDLLSGD